MLQRLIVGGLRPTRRWRLAVHFLDKESGRELASSSSASTTTRRSGWPIRWRLAIPERRSAYNAGAGRSRLYQRGDSVTVERETLKRMVAEHQIRDGGH